MRVALFLAFSCIAAGCGGERASAPPPATAPATTTATVTLSAPTPGPALGECVGHWNGVGTQLNGMSWPIDMVVSPSADGTCGRIEYPSLGCGGYLVECGMMSDGRIYFREVYTHNTGCAPAGEIVAYCSMGRMSWTWTGPGETANATLGRM